MGAPVLPTATTAVVTIRSNLNYNRIGLQEYIGCGIADDISLQSAMQVLLYPYEEEYRYVIGNGEVCR